RRGRLDPVDARHRDPRGLAPSASLTSVSGRRCPVAGHAVRAPATARDNRARSRGAIAGASLARHGRVEQLRPRELLWRRGPDAVGDEELLAVLLGTGVRARPAKQVASELVRTAGGIAALSRASPRELAQVLGVGEDRAARVVAAFELGRRAV